MDDLYGNAWGEPPKNNTNAAPFTSSSAATWVSPKLSVPAQEESDLAAPSWSTGAGLSWDEPSNEAHGFNWANTDPDLAWGASTYEETEKKTPYEQLGQEVTKEEPVSEEPEEPEEDEESTDKPSTESTASTPSSRPPSPPAVTEDLRVEQFPVEEAQPPSPDVDGFGTFATADDHDLHAYAADVTPDMEADAWGSPWGAGQESTAEDDTTRVDEWERARQQQEKLDKMISPEDLANVVQQCKEYCKDAWPDKKGSEAEEEEWRNDWRKGMDGVDGLEALVNSIVPDLSLEPPVQFAQTTLAKNMATAVRLTKNLPLSRSSPLSHYMSARGSTAWETAIMGHKVVEEDVVPVGWRILEKKPDSPVEPAKAGKTGGLFSFWGRRQSKPPAPQADSPREQSPAPRSPSVVSVDAAGGLASARASVDSVRSRSLAREEKTSSPLTEAPSSSTPVIPEDVSPAQPANASYADAPDPHADGAHTPPPPQSQAPSAVSRFLNRFSRRRSTISTHSAHSSFALSSDDLEFLSDIVPNAQDGLDVDLTDPKELSNVLKSEPLPPMLPPPPSAPPLLRPASTVSNKLAPPPSSAALIPRDMTPPSRPSSSKPPPSTHDLNGLDFFGGFESSQGPTVDHSQPSPSTSDVPVGISASSNAQIDAPAKVVREPATSGRPKSPPSLFALPVASTEKQVPQALYLPPPSSSSSRPQSPSAADTSSPPVSSPSSPGPESDSLRRARSPTLRPKVPLSFTIPPPSVSALLPSAPPTASSIMSTQSEVPLGELYPNAMSRRQGSASSFPFALPPPPSSRSYTPGSQSHRVTSPPILAPPPPPPLSNQVMSPPKPLQTADLFDDDDDFADFQSSTTSPIEEEPKAVKPSQPVLAASFSLPPPSGARRATHAIPPPLPLPSSSSLGFGDLPTPQPKSSDPFNVALHSSAMVPSSSSGMKINSFSLASGSEKSLLTPQKGRRTGFEDAESSPTVLRTPSPPRVPAKQARSTHQSISLAPGEKRVKASQHLHTLSLLERAAARPGQWPAPPSPLPQALEFPVPGAPPKKGTDLLSMSEEDSFGTFQTNQLVPPPPSSSSTLLNPSASMTAGLPTTQSLPPVSQSSSRPGSGFGGFGSVQPTLRPSSTTSPSSGTSAKTGGLSAQDLSFFEGL